MKKIALILVCILMTFACIAIAEEEPVVYTSGDYEYILLEDGTAEITDFKGSSSEENIPEKLDGYAVTSIGDRAFYWCKSLTSITIPDSVTSIGDYAFYCCYSLTSISISDSVTSIGIDPFRSCDNLKEIKVSVDHPTLATIDGVLFDKTEKKLICYPFAFTAKRYSIPQGIAFIGDSAFYNCNFLTEIIIPDSVTSIGHGAFSSCFSLTEITIPDSVTSIGDNPFSYCENLTKIKISPDHPTLATIDGVLFDKTEKKLICYPRALTLESYSIPKGISSVGNYAFTYCVSLTEIIIPDSVTSIGDSAFENCVSLTEIIIPDSVTSIGDSAFYSCDLLKEVTIPDSVISIGDSAFGWCDSLAEVTVPASVTFIGKSAFKKSAFMSRESLTLTVDRDSYALQYAKENGIEYTYTDALDWLNS